MKTKTTAGLAKSLALLMMCLAGAFLAGCKDVSDATLEFASLSETRAILQDKPGVGEAVDVRPAAEYAAGHIPGAINLELANVPDGKDSIDPALDRYKYLVVYGSDPGSGSARAMAKRFMSAGHKGVKLFAGGYAEWVSAGLKTEGRGAPSAPSPK